MSPEQLLATINAGENDLNLFGSIHGSPGYGHVIELYKKFKDDKDMQTMACNLFKIDPSKLPELFAGIDQALLLGDNVVAHTASYEAILDSVKSHPARLWAVAKMLS